MTPEQKKKIRSNIFDAVSHLRRAISVLTEIPTSDAFRAKRALCDVEKMIDNIDLLIVCAKLDNDKTIEMRDVATEMRESRDD